MRVSKEGLAEMSERGAGGSPPSASGPDRVGVVDRAGGAHHPPRVPPAETEGVQRFPNLFKAISSKIPATASGTVFSMSLSATEQAFGGAGQAQTAKFDRVFQQGLAKNDNLFAATGDYGSQSFTKQDKNRNLSDHTAVGCPSTSPYVVAVGGTQLQYN
jgi:hypothetical protein